jgi:prevent-host-death family protein
MDVPISQFKATCLELLKKVRDTGQSIRITRHGEVIAEVIPPRPRPGRHWLGRARGSGQILGDLVTPLGDEDWESLQP